MRITYARKVSFFYVAVICTATGGTEQKRACVCRHDLSELPVNDKARNEARIPSTCVRRY